MVLGQETPARLGIILYVTLCYNLAIINILSGGVLYG